MSKQQDVTPRLQNLVFLERHGIADIVIKQIFPANADEHFLGQP